MRYIAAFVLATLSGLSAAKPRHRRAVAQFAAGTNWDIALDNSKLDLAALQAAKGDVIDIDLFDNYQNGDVTTIKDLAATKKVICYFSAGSREEWREDADEFVAGDYGQAMGDWPGENWLNVQSANVRVIMKARIEMAAKAGCHAVDPDNVDGYNENQDGFGYDKSVYVDYVKYLASVAKANNLAIGLKNSIEIISDVISEVQFAVNEQCHVYEECASYKPFTAANKAVFNIEYGLDDCSDPTGVVLSTVIKSSDQQLDTLGGQC